MFLANKNPHKFFYFQTALSLASELSKFTIGQDSQRHASRVAVITYADQYNLVGGLGSFKSYNDVSSALLSLKVSSSSSTAGIAEWAKCFSSRGGLNQRFSTTPQLLNGLDTFSLRSSRGVVEAHRNYWSVNAGSNPVGCDTILLIFSAMNEAINQFSNAELGSDFIRQQTVAIFASSLR